MLSSKCGWLVKRNESHVWQKRWCCVVPHTFLYYFEAGPEIKTEDDGNYEGFSGGGVNIKALAIPPGVFQSLDQEQLNLAVKEGIDGLKGQSHIYASLPSMTFSAAASGGGEEPEDVFSSDWEDTPLSIAEGEKAKYQFVPSNLQPVGIIDLECYSAVNRSQINPTVLEVAGDSITNPDLRSFYFQSATIEDAESWTKALLSDRHQSLKDETEAYKQVCDSFPLQLQHCSEMIDAAEKRASEMEKETYNVRCLAEEGRRKVVQTVREVLERQCWEIETNKKKSAGRSGFINDAFSSDHSIKSKGSRSGRSDSSVDSTNDSSLLDTVLHEQYGKLEVNREAFVKELDATLSSPSSMATSNMVQPVQLLADYTKAISATFSDLRVQLKKYEKNLSQSVEQDQTELNLLKAEILKRDVLLENIDLKHTNMSSEMKSQVEQYQQEVAELTKQLDAQRMEFNMYQNATKNKISELNQHKKVLKKEVIELRKKIDENESETTTVTHKYEKIKNSYQTEKERTATLERYIERLEKQVGVQQNMMDMMSTGGTSFIGKTVGPGYTQCELKDNISLSGMSVGSHCRRDSGSVVGGTTKSQVKSRTLLPPDSKKQRSIDQISPMKSPKTTRNDTGMNREDAISTMYQSETTTEIETPTESSDSDPTGQKKPITIDKDLVTEDEILSPMKSDDTAASHNSIGSDKMKPTINLKSSKTTPVQSNSLNDETFAVDSKQSHANSKKVTLPNLDTDTNEGLNHLTPLAPFPPTDPDDEDDIKSRVSDITEDRTQRQIDDDLAERRKILIAYMQGNTTGGLSNTSLSASTQHRLETIESMMPNANGESGTRSASGLPRVGSVASLDSQSGNSQESGKLSIAQRMRLAADNGSNTHRSLSPMKLKDDTSNPSKAPSLTPLEKSGSFFSKLGKSIENLVDNSIVGVKSYDSDDDSESATSESASEKLKHQSQLSLKERISMQRQKQVEFLKNKGVIDDESSLHGGAGGSSIASHKTSTPTKKTFTPRNGVGRSWSRN